MSVRGISALVAAAIATVGSLVAVATPASATPDEGYYLSLGDSLAYGYQPDLPGDYNAADYHGYAENFAAMRPHLTLVNYGCWGETTSTLLNGGCTWPAAGLHDSYGGAASQAAAAYAFLAAHPGQTSLITVDVGSNDVKNLISSCGGNAQCIVAGLPATLTKLAGNYANLLAHLTALAPTARLVLFNYYNPFALKLAGSDELLTAANPVIDQLATTFHASVADAFSAMNHAVGSPAEDTFVCIHTWECTSYQDIHPTDLGYRALTIALLTALD